MNSILKARVFPWHEPAAFELRERLVEVFPTHDDTLEILNCLGLPKYKFLTNQALYYLWRDILERAARDGLLIDLIKITLSYLNDKHPSYFFFMALLSNESIVISASAGRNDDGSAIFIQSTDKVSKEEALLYYDDLMLQIGKLPFLINTLQLLIKVAPAICHLLVDVDGVQQRGTAFRIGEQILLTNWHVVHSKNGVSPSAITAEFIYEDNGNGGFVNSKKLKCRVDNLEFNKEDDWAVISVNEPLCIEWPIIKLSESVAPKLNAPAYIIQHPQGQSKRLGYVRNQITDFTDKMVYYFTDTQDGSSGSPVFDADARLVAIHRAGGNPQRIPGIAPVKKNEGILVSKIYDELKKREIYVP